MSIDPRRSNAKLLQFALTNGVNGTKNYIELTSYEMVWFVQGCYNIADIYVED